MLRLFMLQHKVMLQEATKTEEAAQCKLEEELLNEVRHHSLLLHKQAHDKRDIAESLHAYIWRARSIKCVRYVSQLRWDMYHSSGWICITARVGYITARVGYVSQLGLDMYHSSQNIPILSELKSSCQSITLPWGATISRGFQPSLPSYFSSSPMGIFLGEYIYVQ